MRAKSYCIFSIFTAFVVVAAAALLLLAPNTFYTYVSADSLTEGISNTQINISCPEELSLLENSYDRAAITDDFTITSYNCVNQFYGMLDGRGHTLTVDISEDFYDTYEHADAGEIVGGIFAKLGGCVSNLNIRVISFSHYVNNVGCSAGMLCGVLSGGEVENVQIILDYDSLDTGNDYLIERAEHDNLGYPDNIVSLGGIAGYSEGEVNLTNVKVINNLGLTVFARPISDNEGNFYNIGGFIGRNNSSVCNITNGVYEGQGETSCLISVPRSQAVVSMSAFIGVSEIGNVIVDGLIIKDDCKIVSLGRESIDYIGYIIGLNNAIAQIFNVYIPDGIQLNAIGSDSSFGGAVIYPTQDMSLDWDNDKLSIAGLKKQLLTSESLIYSLTIGSEEYPVYKLLLTDKTQEAGLNQVVSISRGNISMESKRPDCEMKLNYALCGKAGCGYDYNGTSYYYKHVYDGNLPKAKIELSVSDNIKDEYSLFVCNDISADVGKYEFKLAYEGDKYDIINFDGVKAVVDTKNAVIYSLYLLSDIVEVEITKADASITFSQGLNLSISYGSEININLFSDYINTFGFIDGVPSYKVAAIDRYGAHYVAGSSAGEYKVIIEDIALQDSNIKNYEVYIDSAILNVTPVKLSGNWDLPSDAIYNAAEHTARFIPDSDSQNLIFSNDNIDELINVNYYKLLDNKYVAIDRSVGAGEYMAEIYVNSGNYIVEYNTSAYFYINKKNAVIDISCKEIVYGDTQQDIYNKTKIYFNGFIFGVSTEIIISGSADMAGKLISLGIGDIVCEDGADNYACRINDIQVSVEAKQVLTDIKVASFIEYNAQTHEAKLNVNGLVLGDSASLRYCKIVEGKKNYIEGIPIDAGNYQAELYGDILGSNYNIEEGSVTSIDFTIEKRQVSCILPNIEIEYSTSKERIFSQEYRLSVIDALNDYIYDAYEITLLAKHIISGEEYQIGASAGSEYNVVIEIDCDKSNNYIFNIVSGKMHVCYKHLDGYFFIDNNQSGDIAYNGKEIEYSYHITTPIYDNEHIELIFEYFKDECLLLSPPIDSGEYKVKVYTYNANYYLSETLNFTISKALITIVALHEYTFEYDGQVRIADIYYDAEQQSSLPIDSCHINIRVIGDKVLRDVGEYDIELYLSECTNYRADIATAHVNIVPKYIAIDINGNADKVYDGVKLYAYELDFLFDNIAGDTDIAISNSAGEEINYILNAGEYTVSATHANANYSGGACLDVSVYKAQREISVFIAPVYGGVKVISDTDGKIVFSLDGVAWIDLPKDNIIPLELNAEYKLNLMSQEDVNYLASEALIATAKMTPEILNEYISQLLFAEYSEENATLYNKILEIDCLFEEQRNQDYIDNLTKLRSLYSNSLPKVVIIAIAMSAFIAVAAVISFTVIMVKIKKKRNFS